MFSHVLHTEMAAALIARVFLGLLFMFQGYDAVFGMKPKGIIGAIAPALSAKGVPPVLINSGAYFTSYTELIGGLLLLIGFVKYYALYLLGFDLILAAFAFSLIKPMWDMTHVFPRLALLIFLLIMPANWDVFSIDYVWSIFKFIHSL